MRITHTWANMAHTNSFLKITTICLSLTVTVLGFLSLSLLTQDPLVIERECRSKTVSISTKEHTPQEIKNFLEEAIIARFNTEVESPQFLSLTERKKREKEQRALKKQEMKQTLIVGDITFDENSVIVHTDRLISVKDIRSAFIFKLTVEFATVKRSEVNPYGLILTQVAPLEPPLKEKDKK